VRAAAVAIVIPVVSTVVTAVLGLSSGPAAADPLVLPPPLADDAQSTALCGAVGSRPDRCLTSTVPGPVRNDEVVLVGLGGDGTPAVVELEQRLRITGTGDYAVRERGPARQARSLGELDPPVTKLGAVVWQGFSPGSRDLAALLRLDAGLEAVRLPLSARLTWTPRGGTPTALPPGGVVTGPGTASLVIANETAQPAELPVAEDVAPAALVREVAPALDALRVRAARDRAVLDGLAVGAPGPPGGPALGERLPAAGSGLPTAVDVRAPARVAGEQSVPLNLVASLTADGAIATPVALGGAPPAPAVPGGARLVGTLPGGQSVGLAVEVDGPAVLDLRVTAVPALDPRALTPPDGAASWAAWARSAPGAEARRGALDRLVSAAAAGARASAFSPYLGADLPGSGSTVFRLALAPVEELPQAADRLELQEGPLAVTGVAVGLLLLHAALLWRRS
jgi:hypothetical protein